MAGTPDHPITVTPNPNRIKVTFGGRVVADTKKALTLKEADYPPVQYLPRSDLDMSLLIRTEHHSHCPYKGDASYYSINADGRTAENAIWSYEKPLADMAEITGYVAFYPNRVDAIEQTPE
jgi:uncharacterized protein (DUF427 family)